MRPRIALLRRGLTLLTLLSGVALAQEARVLEVEGGAPIKYALRTFAHDAHRPETLLTHAPGSALDTAQLVTQLLAEGKLEDVALLSNAPKARFARLRESFDGWKKEDFERTFRRYFAPENRLVGEAVIDRHHLLMWHLKDADYITAYYLVEVDGRLLLDDVPSETRNQLRRILEAHRARH